MLQNSALRGIYGAPRSKNVATVSPVFDDDTDRDYDEENPPGDGHERIDEAGNNTAARSPPHRANEDFDQTDILELKLQTKSSVLSPSSRFFFGRSASNQDLETTSARSASSDKYAVLGQKQQWRRNRSQRPHRSGGQAKIKHVSAEEADAHGEDREELGERASSYVPSSHDDTAVDIPVLATGRVQSYASQHSSRESSGQDSSRFSSGRRSEDGSIVSEHELFVITRQKKSKFAAKLYLPGQKPLYLGRYRSEDAARLACESAFTNITTPRK